MQVTIELTGEQVATLQAQAETQGLTVEGWLQRMTEQYAPADSVAHLQRTDPQEWVRRFRAWAESHDRTTPPLSENAVRRDNIYPD